jgi:S-adenosylmethionine:tRNA ribosyltransferase-isomerase
MNISEFNYDLPDGRIAKFPLEERDASKLLVWRGADTCRSAGADMFRGGISETVFGNIGDELPEGSLLVFNNTRVVRARLVMHKPAVENEGVATVGARIEILCLEPHSPADYERAFAAKGGGEWICMVGGLKKWKSGPIEIPFHHNGKEHKLQAWRAGQAGQAGQAEHVVQAWQAEQAGPAGQTTKGEQLVRFEWSADLTFGQILELLGRVPIPPYLDRDSAAIDNTRYQTVYSRFEGSVAAPTAGLHFTPELIERLKGDGNEFDEVTLHVGAGTFLPVKVENALEHPMHTEHFEVTLATVEHLLTKLGNIVAVGTTSVRTLESLTALAWRIETTGCPEFERPVGQFELRQVAAEFSGEEALRALADRMRARRIDKIAASTQIMITPGFRFRIVDGIITNFHQPQSTLLLLVSAFLGYEGRGDSGEKADGAANGKTEGAASSGKEWRRIYDYALTHGFRFLSYGDSSLLLR